MLENYRLARVYVGKYDRIAHKRMSYAYREQKGNIKRTWNECALTYLGSQVAHSEQGQDPQIDPQP